MEDVGRVHGTRGEWPGAEAGLPVAREGGCVVREWGSVVKPWRSTIRARAVVVMRVEMMRSSWAVRFLHVATRFRSGCVGTGRRARSAGCGSAAGRVAFIRVRPAGV